MTNHSAAPSHGAPASDGPDETPDAARIAFGADLSAARRAHGWTLDELAGRAGITRKTLSRLENGHAARISTVRDLERAFDVPENTFTSAYYGETTLRQALAGAGWSGLATRAAHQKITRTGESDTLPGMEDDALDVAVTRRVPATRYGARPPELPDDAEGRPVLRADDVFALAQNLPLPELRRLRERIDAVVQFLERPRRAEAIRRAIAELQPIQAQQDAARAALIEARARLHAELDKHRRVAGQHRAPSAAVTRAEEEVKAADEVLVDTHGAYLAWLDMASRELSKAEFAEVVARLGGPTRRER